MRSERNCPVCGNEANSKHHIKPRDQGGSDDPRNIRWLCKRCHDWMEELQKETGLELCPELLYWARQELKIKLEADKESGVEESWRYPNFLIWICLPGQTKKWICQHIGYEPGEQPAESIKEEQTKPKKRRGYPGKPEIDTSYLEELVYNKGLSYRKASKQLLWEGFKVSHTAIAKRLLNSKNYQPIQQVACKQCNTLFAPKGNRRIFCSPECYEISKKDCHYKERNEKAKLLRKASIK